VIGGRPLLSSFTIASSDRVAGRRVTVTVSFTPSAGGALAPGGFITLNYPSNFFARDSGIWIPNPTPGVSVHHYGLPTTSSAHIFWISPGSTGTLAASTAVNLVLEGIVIGTASAGGNITVQTSADPLASLPQASGVLGGRPLLSSFSIALSDRVAGRTAAVATFSFTPTVGGALATNGSITLNYPAGFFASGLITAQLSAPGVSLTVAPPGASSVTMTVTGGTFAAATAVTVTLAGFTMGSPTAGGDITVQTSADPFASLPQASGAIITAAGYPQDIPSQQSNAFQLSFVTGHLCSSLKVTRDCLLTNISFFRSGHFY